MRPSKPVLTWKSVASVVITFGVLGLVLHKMFTMKVDVEPSEVENVCLGFWGCGSPSVVEVLPLVVLGVVGLPILYAFISGHVPRGMR